MKMKLKQRVKIVIEALLEGRTVEMIIANSIYKVGMSESYDILFEAKQLCETTEKPVWLVTNMSLKVFIEHVRDMDSGEIYRVATETALYKTRT